MSKIFHQLVASVVTAGLAVMLLLANAFQMLSLLILPISRSLFRRINRWLADFWWGSACLAVEKVLPIPPVITGDDLPSGENAIVIANHQQMPDIVALMMLGRRKGRLGDFKWFVKDVIKYIPGIGWGMIFLDCLFLKRQWDKDQAHVEALFAKFSRDRIPIWLLSFVEGTRIRPAKLKKSQDFAAKNGLPILQNVMLPRTRGFWASVVGLQGHGNAVYDITIGYEGGVPSMGTMILQPEGRKFHLHVKRYPLSAVPTEIEANAKWLVDRFVEKDALLAKFKREGRFD